ncbi:DUF551 domain-containing protein [Salmonella enterica]|nr:DUF551 domain-containing protein [Salmonella enterica]EEM0195312.1 DUF551 domain-containing protein [Salmonella enterica subsp. enterica serovar Liverpool]EGM4842245.1 DUF551 domain-containing protein [Salmonella enterica subsp. enterica serovar Liverpool]EGM6827843.1 DUF551 domain-containing protein [Salmonella enterica subsp. enterica serovar Liverpool]EIG1568026.1 DUF551 domain-containing protein [Salmonella enterica subsp. enterica serovar Liverpool]
MTTITKEWLQQTIAEFENTRDDIPFGLSDDDAKILIVLKRALASLDAEPVRYLNKFSGTCVTLEQQSNAADDVAVYMPLYTAPPVPVQVDIEMLASALKNAPLAPSDNQGRPRAPVVPPAIEPDYKVIKSILPTANPDEYACTIAADMWNACRAAMLQSAEPVSQTYELPELIEGMEVSIDVSTCDADAGNRYFGTVTEVSELDTAKNGYILLVQDAKPNFDVNDNSPVIPGGWISCSERMPEQGAYISVVSKHGEYAAGQVIDDWLDLHDGTSFGLDEVYLWMMLPPLPASPQQ